MEFTTVGLNIAIIAAIIAFTNVIKGFDKNNKLDRFYILIPLFLGIIAAVFMTKPLEWQGVGYNGLVYGAISAYLYKAKKKIIVSGIEIDPNKKEGIE